MENLGLPVAYLAVAEGAPVYNPSGSKVGTVEHVVADDASDVFHGLMVKTDSGDQPHLFADREQVSGLYERGVQLAVAADQLHRPTDDAATAAATDEPAGDRLQAGIRKAWDRLSCHGRVDVSGVDVEVLRSVPDATLSRLRRYAHLPDAFHAMHTGNSAFEVPGVDGVIVYRPSGRIAFQFGAVFAAPDRQAELLHAFMRWAAEDRRRVVAVQLQREDVDLYVRAGFAVNQLGVSYARSLTGGFSLSGKHMAKIRAHLSRAVRDGVVVRELADVAEQTPQVTAGLDEVDRSWLKGKGFGAGELDFMIGERGRPADQLCRMFVAEQEGRIVGYQTFSPVFGRHAG